ncbi:MAG TPA: hypothetical protein VFB29_03870 [Pseudolabrys sp.]|nr:hypothetical protein [Pseudolabrys sp.]
MAALIIVGTTLLLTGCAGYSPECVTGTGTKDCAPGTMGHQQMVQQQQGEETVASIDDARCRTYGQPGSREYFECRQRAASARSRGR